MFKVIGILMLVANGNTLFEAKSEKSFNDFAMCESYRKQNAPAVQKRIDDYFGKGNVALKTKCQVNGA